MKALFFDIDGTLIDWRSGVLEVPRDVVCEMRRIRDEGNRLFVSSGRPRSFIGPEFRDLGCFDGYVLLNGGQIEYEGTVIYEELLGAEVARTVCDLHEEAGCGYSIDTATRVCIDGSFADMLDFLHGHLLSITTEFDRDEAIREAIKIESCPSNDQRAFMAERIERELAQRACYDDNGTGNTFEVYSPRLSKATGIARVLGISPRFLSGIEMYFPSRTGRISMSNPASSVESEKVWPSGIFSINTDIDKELMIVPIETMKSLLEHDDEVSAVELRLTDGLSERDVRRLQKEIAGQLGPDYKVKNRFQQNEALYKMMRYEKVAIYMILIFVIIIIAFNIFGSLSMLIIEKKKDVETLSALGAPDSLIRRIFVLEGWLISLSGMAAGLVVGTGFSLLQQHFGFIKMPGHFVVQAYPIILSLSDILITAAGVALIGYLIALIPSSRLKDN